MIKWKIVHIKFILSTINDYNIEIGSNLELLGVKEPYNVYIFNIVIGTKSIEDMFAQNKSSLWGCY